ncbi:MAG: diguanylate cyclase [Bacteroidales bacterium]|nr:diguanylate cyclase [Bacteroidales bacterium]
MENWANGLEQVAITVTDEKGDFIDMNAHSRRVNLKSPDDNIIGKNIMGCHNERSQAIINHMMSSKECNVYTITKKGQKKLIYQSPWYKDNGDFGGLVELSLVIPFEMPHYDRDKN